MEKPAVLELVHYHHPYKIYSRKYIKDNFYKISQRAIARRLGMGKTTVNK